MLFLPLKSSIQSLNKGVVAFVLYIVLNSERGPTQFALSKRSTIYLDPALHQALRIKSVETSRSMSDIINEIIKYSIQDEELTVLSVANLSFHIDRKSGAAFI